MHSIKFTILTIFQCTAKVAFLSGIEYVDTVVLVWNETFPAVSVGKKCRSRQRFQAS